MTGTDEEVRRGKSTLELLKRRAARKNVSLVTCSARELQWIECAGDVAEGRSMTAKDPRCDHVLAGERRETDDVEVVVYFARQPVIEFVADKPIRHYAIRPVAGQLTPEQLLDSVE